MSRACPMWTLTPECFILDFDSNSLLMLTRGFDLSLIDFKGTAPEAHIDHSAQISRTESGP